MAFLCVSAIVVFSGVVNEEFTFKFSGEDSENRQTPYIIERKKK